jgi:nucleotide-binding universal stress UspA family protein
MDRFCVGPVAQAVLEHASQPVLAVRPGEPAARFRKVLCAVDHSLTSRQGLSNAVRLTRVFGGELIILSVIPPVHWLSAAVGAGQLSDARAAHGRRWEEEFERFLDRVDLHGVLWSSEVRHGFPDEEIVATARKHQADVLVMGATGRTGLARLLLGSVTRRVLSRLPCSLLTVKQEDVVGEQFEEDVRAVKVLMAQAQGLHAAQSYAAAAAKFRQALGYNPFNGPALENLAEALHRLGQEQEAGFYHRRAEVLRRHGGE